MPDIKMTPRETIPVDFYDEIDVRVKQPGEINVAVGQPGVPKNDNIRVNLDPPDIAVDVVDSRKNVYEFKLNLRRALNGDFMIFDHADIDIMILLEKKKIVAFAKDMMSEVVYGAENRLFNYLRRKGVIAYDSIQGGSVYGSMEGLLLEKKDDGEPEALDYVLFQISEWVKEEKPHTDFLEAHDEMMDDALLDPEEGNSTELGEVPHEEEKGSIKQRGLFAPYLYGRYTY
jgi:hypothetical protein